MKRAVIYARVSTDDQDAQNQITQMKDFISNQEWKRVKVITDVASGGKGRSDRPGLAEVFAMAHRRECDVLLFWSLDRLSREGSRQTIAYLEQLESHGVDWHSYTEPYISSLGVFSDAIIALLSALAKQERVRIGERTKAGLERARAAGKKLGRPKGDGSKAKQAAKLKAQGLSYAEIGRKMRLSRGRAFQLVKAV